MAIVFTCEFSFGGSMQSMPVQKMGRSYWEIEASHGFPKSRLIDDLLGESIVGLTALAVNEGKSDVMVWMESNAPAYLMIKSQLPMSCLGKGGVWEILGSDDVRRVVRGYVLYDLANQESINVATVASHVYHGVMIEQRDIQKAEGAGYKLLYDASDKTLDHAWSEFKGKCRNNGLVLMPTQTSEQRSTAIAFRLMCVNLNKQYANALGGYNKNLIEEILMWLKPVSPVFGWEQGQSEDQFVSLVSRSGNVMVPYDWAINTPVMSAGYQTHKPPKVSTLDPTTINYGNSKHYFSFLMSDGDNVQWMINGFDTPLYFSSSDIEATKMSFGYPIANLSMISPWQHDYLVGRQNSASSMVESFGGGYYYIDNFGELKNRRHSLDKVAKMTAFHMRANGCRVLSLIAQDVRCKESTQAYQSYIENNDQLIGIVAVQYSPYSGGGGEVMWFKNSRGVEIPVVTVRYTIWHFENGLNMLHDGTPAYIASLCNDLASQNPQESTFSVTSVHAWSSFKNIGSSNDPTAENNLPPDATGVTPALWCADRLDKKVKVVNVEELIWQLRMHYYPEQTKTIIKLN